MAGGQRYIVALVGYSGNGYRHDVGPAVQLILKGTVYNRYYPTETALGEPPTIADLPGGYATLNAFCLFWQQATPEQRESMERGDKEIHYDAAEWRGHWHYGQRRRTFPKLAKWKPRTPDKEPRILPASNGLPDGFSRFYTKDLIAALKGTRQAVRFGPIIVKPTILRQLARLNGPTLEVRVDGGTVQLRTPDQRQRITLRHGAGDRYAGRNGYEATVAWEQ